MSQHSAELKILGKKHSTRETKCSHDFHLKFPLQKSETGRLRQRKMYREFHQRPSHLPRMGIWDGRTCNFKAGAVKTAFRSALYKIRRFEMSPRPKKKTFCITKFVIQNVFFFKFIPTMGSFQNVLFYTTHPRSPYFFASRQRCRCHRCSFDYCGTEK